MAKNKRNNFKTLAGLVFVLVSITHLTIIVTGSYVAINEVALDIWINWLAVIVTGYLGLVAFEIV